jgi:hypothetical protein
VLSELGVPAVPATASVPAMFWVVPAIELGEKGDSS